MPEITGLREVQRKFRELEAKAGKEDSGSVIVGFNANYAAAVHEKVAMTLQGLPRQGYKPPGKKAGGQKRKGRYWDPQGRGQAKFLEQPAKEQQGEIVRIVEEAFKKGTPLVRSLFIGGLHLQREAQKLVPVEDGNLKGSAFTEIE